jgi:hypothetical protein
MGSSLPLKTKADFGDIFNYSTQTHFGVIVKLLDTPAMISFRKFSLQRLNFN